MVLNFNKKVIMAVSGICIFCRIPCLSRCNCCRSDLFPLFLRYLNTIKYSNLEGENNFCREDFHCCGKCANLLGTISKHVCNLGQDLLKIYSIMCHNMGEIEGNETLENLMRQILRVRRILSLIRWPINKFTYVYLK